MADIVVEFIGFFIAIFFLVAASLRKRWEDRDRQEHPENYKEEPAQEQQLLRELLKEMNVELEEEPQQPPDPPVKQVAPPAPPTAPARKRVSEDYDFHSNIESRSKETHIEDRTLNIHVGDEWKKNLGQLDLQDNPKQDMYEFHRERSKARAKQLLEGLDSKQDMILLHTILGPPKGLE